MYCTDVNANRILYVHTNNRFHTFIHTYFHMQFNKLNFPNVQTLFLSTFLHKSLYIHAHRSSNMRNNINKIQSRVTPYPQYSVTEIHKLPLVLLHLSCRHGMSALQFSDVRSNHLCSGKRKAEIIWHLIK